MKSDARIRWLLFFILSLVFALTTCSDDPTPTPNLTPSATITVPTPSTIQGQAFLDSMQIAVLESFPVQVQVTLVGNLSNGCTSSAGTNVQRQDSTFILTVMTDYDATIACTQALVPFTEVVPLDVAGLPAGTYTVVANGLTDTFNLATDNALPPTPDPGSADGGQQPDGGGNAPVSQTNIYLIALEDNGQSGRLVGCNDSVVPVVIDIEPTAEPMTAAINRLLIVKDQFYGQSGLYHSLYQSNLTLQGINIVNREAIINLTGHLQLSGVCDDPRVVAQLEQTALQYGSVDRVSILLNGEPLPSQVAGRG